MDITSAETRACLKNHSRNLHAPLCGIFHPNSVAVARYGALIRAKYPTNCDAHLAESLFQTRSKATYDEIKKYVAEHNAGMKVSNLYISQVKRKCGIEVGKNYNLPKNEDSRQPQCPEDKESAIVEALKHFKMNS